MRLASLALAIGGVVAVAGTAEACPDWSLSPSFGQITLYSGYAPDPYIRNVTAGGGYNLQQCGLGAWGWVARAPDFDLYYTAGGYPLTIIVDSSVDTVLLINGPDGTWYFDDDSGYNLGGAITIPYPQSGLYDIWIGTYYQGSGIPARLYITELAY